MNPTNDTLNLTPATAPMHLNNSIPRTDSQSAGGRNKSTAAATTTNLSSQEIDSDSILTNVAVSTVQRLAESSDKCSRLRLDFEKVRRDLLNRNINNSISEEQKQDQTIKSSLLPLNFIPGPNRVIVGHGRVREHKGNQKLKHMARMYLEQYRKAEYDKNRKTEIVSMIVTTINESCDDGIGFVKRRKDGRWEAVSLGSSREKVGYTFRDLLADR